MLYSILDSLFIFFEATKELIPSSLCVPTWNDDGFEDDGDMVSHDCNVLCSSSSANSYLLDLRVHNCSQTKFGLEQGERGVYDFFWAFSQLEKLGQCRNCEACSYFRSKTPFFVIIQIARQFLHFHQQVGTDLKCQVWWRTRILGLAISDYIGMKTISSVEFKCIFGQRLENRFPEPIEISDSRFLTYLLDAIL